MQDFFFECDDIETNIISNEMFNYPRFKLNYHNWKYSFLTNNFFDIGTMQLPWDATYHTADNWFGGVQQDYPNIVNDPFISNEMYYKWIYHQTIFQLNGPIQYDTKYNYLTSGLSTILNAFRSQYKAQFRYLQKLEDTPRKKESLTIINYNPLFRCYTFGALQYFKKVNLILSTMFNTVAHMIDMYPDKHQYILIPWNNEIYTQDQFTRTKKKIDISSLRNPNSFHFIFMVYLMNFIDPNTDLGLFNQYPEKYWKETNLVFRNGNKATIFNLEDLKTLNDKNRAYLKVVSHLNILSTIGSSTIVLDTSEVDGISGPTDRIPVITETKCTISLPDITTVPLDKTNPEVTDKSESVSKDPVPIVDTTQSIMPSSIIGTTKSVIQKTFIPMVKSTVSIMPKVISKSDTPNQILEDTKPVMRNLIPQLASNITQIESETDPNVIKQRSKEYLEDIDAQAVTYIDNREDLTPKQKERLKTVAKKYKQVTIGEETLQDIILKNNDVLIDEDPPQSVIDTLPDKTMAKSKAFHFDKAYIHKTMKKDLASIAVNFNKLGMFLTDIKTSQTINELTQSEEYTFKFEDVQGKSHTVKFSVPIIDSNGYCYINGVKKYLKKQMINIPICKIGENKVSMVSNQNKVLILRNETKAHSFDTQIDKIVELGKSVLNIIYGTLDLNLSLAYEYVSIAQKYNTITIKSQDGKSHTLCFDYYNRFKDIADVALHSKLDALEKQYGTLFGKDGHTGYYFIDTNNLVSLITLDRKDITPSDVVSIVDIFKTTYPKELASKIGFITEWIDINLVSKPLPVGFILAYRYGLVNMMDHLGVKYKLLAKRGNSVLEESEFSGENVISATESFDTLTMDKVINIDTRRKWKIDDVKHLELLEKYNISKTECIISGSAAMIAHRYPNCINNDLDIVVTDRVYAKLKKDTTNFSVHKARDGIGTDIKLVSKDEKLEITKYFHALSEEYTFDVVKKESVNVIDEYMFTDLDFLFKMYTKLNRPKDQDKIKWLTEHQGKTVAANESLISHVTDKIIYIEDEAHHLVNANEALTVDKYTYTPGDIVIKFKDCNLVFNRYPMYQSLIMCGLDHFNTQAYTFDEFNMKDVYYSLMEDRGIKSNYLKAVNSFFDLFMDPITKDVLQQMGEPTNVQDLLIRASVLLTTKDHKEASSIANHRIRSYEQFNAIIYNEMARAYAAYQVGRGKGNTFSVNPNAVFQRIIQNPSFTIVEDINPIQELKERAGFTFAGVGGRTSESFVVDDRRYPEDGIGIISESTVDNAKVSMNAYLTVDPTIANTRGIIDIEALNKLSSSNVLSVTALNAPCAMHDDGDVEYTEDSALSLCPTK